MNVMLNPIHRTTKKKRNELFSPSVEAEYNTTNTKFCILKIDLGLSWQLLNQKGIHHWSIIKCKQSATAQMLYEYNV